MLLNKYGLGFRGFGEKEFEGVYILAQSYMDSQGILSLQSSMVWLWGLGNQWSMA